MEGGSDSCHGDDVALTWALAPVACGSQFRGHPHQNWEHDQRYRSQSRGEA